MRANERKIKVETAQEYTYVPKKWLCERTRSDKMQAAAVEPNEAFYIRKIMLLVSQSLYYRWGCAYKIICKSWHVFAICLNCFHVASLVCYILMVYTFCILYLVSPQANKFCSAAVPSPTTPRVKRLALLPYSHLTWFVSALRDV